MNQTACRLIKTLKHVFIRRNFAIMLCTSGLSTEQMLLKDMKAVSTGDLNLAVSIIYMTLEVSTVMTSFTSGWFGRFWLIPLLTKTDIYTDIYVDIFRFWYFATFFAYFLKWCHQIAVLYLNDVLKDLITPLQRSYDGTLQITHRKLSLFYSLLKG